ncbi:membrane protein [Longispora fulva]|uniref:Putative iron-regulated membrane protein n=1 Tax=Longispora fulva TaxID=619741 RepID=A0A8J7GHK7_9ACTN|nr:PepSY domain-containing protein [Longispora fulva]MBG6136747.1 putative iron-regulated membrane protein [Longispora fulva]GIG59917.1 membrane protein [Longispora fulva]
MSSVLSPTAPPGAAPEPTRPIWSLTPLLRRLHFYAGLLVAPFLIVAAVSGLAYSVAPQIDDILYSDVLYSRTDTGPQRTLAEQVTAARTAVPDGTLTGVLPADGDKATRVVFARPGLGADYRRTVYVDPHTADVQGQLTTWFGSTPAVTWLDGLHRHLQLGEPGRLYSELAASWLWLIALGGLILWWGRLRGRRRLRALLTPEKGIRGVRRTRSWHAAIGVWTLLGALLLSATGLTWSTYAGDNFNTALTALRAKAVPLDTTLPGSTGAPGMGGGHEGHGVSAAGADRAPTDPATFDRVLLAARTAGLTGPLEIGVAEEPGSAWTAAQVDNVWPVRRDQIAADPTTGAVTARASFADRPFLARLTTLGVQAHMGVLFGPANQIFLALTALGILTMIVLGYRMWWQRRPTRADRRSRLGAPPVRGGWRGLPLWALIPGPLVVVAVGWAIPLLGLSLAAFLVLDLVIGTARRSRRPASAT